MNVLQKIKSKLTPLVPRRRPHPRCLARQPAASGTPPARDPLILDLDGDGIETTRTSASLHFDHAGDGFVERSAWVGKDDGLLVWDKNGNGQIDNGTELFGADTLLRSGAKATAGSGVIARALQQRGRAAANQVWKTQSAA